MQWHPMGLVWESKGLHGTLFVGVWEWHGIPCDGSLRAHMGAVAGAVPSQHACTLDTGVLPPRGVCTRWDWAQVYTAKAADGSWKLTCRVCVFYGAATQQHLLAWGPSVSVSLINTTIQCARLVEDVSNMYASATQALQGVQATPQLVGQLPGPKPQTRNPNPEP